MTGPAQRFPRRSLRPVPDPVIEVLEAVRAPFELSASATAAPLGNGHINETVLVTDGQRHLVAQRINTSVFSDPGALVRNARRIESHLAAKSTRGQRVVRHLEGRDGRFLHGPSRDVRVLEYIPGSCSIEVLESAGQAKLAARAFAEFSRSLSDFESARLEIVIPDFHSPDLRHRQFLEARANDRVDRVRVCAPDIDLVLEYEALLKGWQGLMNELPARVCHNDCKINNLLLDQRCSKALAIIDLDTCMPGPLLTDFGDLVRTCCSPETEDSLRLDSVFARPEIFAALAGGYVRAWGSAITCQERESLLEGGMMMCFLVGLRFLTDYLDGDRYFSISRPSHNLERARNQFRLFLSLREQRATLEKFV